MSQNQFFGTVKDYSISYDTHGFFQVSHGKRKIMELCPYPMNTLSDEEIASHFDVLKKRAFHMFAEVIGEKEEVVMKSLKS